MVMRTLPRTVHVTVQKIGPTEKVAVVLFSIKGKYYCICKGSVQSMV